MKNVFTVREYEGLQKLRESLKDAKKLVVIGASFIGLESAASIKGELKDKLDVVVCESAKTPYERVLGTVKQTTLYFDGKKLFNLSFCTYF